ncbi:hypothetical protein [Primorskyibacter sedentarius]|nr:hypothetical protein [Primorskyibacter sedentarius]
MKTANARPKRADDFGSVMRPIPNVESTGAPDNNHGITPGMNGMAFHHLRVYFAALLLAVTSVTSAAMLAPDRAEAALAQLSVLGMNANDICGEAPGHDHRCPYCHLLADTPMPCPSGLETRLQSVMAWKLAADLYRAAQARDHARSPRAPPSIL